MAWIQAMHLDVAEERAGSVAPPQPPPSSPSPPSSSSSTPPSLTVTIKQHEAVMDQIQQPSKEYSMVLPSPSHPTRIVTTPGIDKPSPEPLTEVTPSTPSTVCSTSSSVSPISLASPMINSPPSLPLRNAEERSLSIRRSNSCGNPGNAEPHHGSDPAVMRRCIFTTRVWNQGHHQKGRQLESSFPLPRPPTAITYRQIEKLVRPPANRCLNKSHFRAMEEQQPEMDALAALPPHLPSPMQRFYSDSLRTTRLGGVYPLISPTSILRKSSHGLLPATSATPSPPHPKQLEIEWSGSSSHSSTTSIVEGHIDVNVSTFHISEKISLAEVPQEFQQRDQQDLDRMETSSTSHSSGQSIDEVDSQQEKQEAPGESTFTSSPLGNGAGNSTQPMSKSSTLCPTKRVRFDPRVTVTEFQDSFPRLWYSAFELERFQKESSHLVQKYFIAHPSKIMEYSEPRLDVVTGRYRRRAPFSIPILNANTLEEEEELLKDCASFRNSKRTCGATDFMAQTQVRHILIAARNHIVSDLLSRSLKTIFPHATFTTVTTGEEALRVFCDRSCRCDGEWRGRGYDLVVADGPLNRSLSRSPVALSMDRIHLNRSSSSTVTGHQTDSRTSLSLSNLSSMTKPTSSSSSSSLPPPSCGAELFRCIREITNNRREIEAAAAATSAPCPSGRTSRRSDKNKRPKDSSSSMEAVPTAPFSGSNVPLLIGLTTSNPKEGEGRAMTENGAGIVWTLPPPRMDERLRDEIVARLLQKRQYSG